VALGNPPLFDQISRDQVSQSATILGFKNWSQKRNRDIGEICAAISF
jgi:hypothetical protein